MSVDDKSTVTGSGSSRPLRMILRSDLQFIRQCYQGRVYWMVKDPLSLKYYRFEQEEYALLQMFDGLASPDQIKQRFDAEFAPQKIRSQELFQFIGMLHRSCLLISDQAGQGIELHQRSQQRARRQIRGSFANLLAIRIKGFDPDRLLTWLVRYTGWFFTWPAAVVVMIIGILSVGIVVTQFETLTNRLPGFQEFFAAENWIWLALVVVFTKVLHELGHGLACKRMGGQCHEMGVMFLVLMPCLYCNVSDTWMITNKWSRAFIAAAGMYVELVVAAIATMVWWFSQPGLVNQLSFNIIVVSSISTLLFNGNPLLRYDGYYILSDILEIPNLRQKSSAILQRWMGRLFLGIPSRPDPFLPARNMWLFASYSIAAVVYRWLIMFSIFWFLYEVLEPYGAKIIGQMIALLAVWSLLGVPLLKLYKYFSIPGRWDTVKPIRGAITMILTAGVLGAFLLIPIPHYVHCFFYVQPRDATNIFVDVPGTLVSVVAEPNQYVALGDPLICLNDDELGQQIEKLKGRVRVKQAAYESVKFMSQRDYTMLDELDAAKSELTAAEEDLEQREVDLPRLTIRAKVDGILLEPPRVNAAANPTSELQGWSGSPLKRHNLGAFLDQKTLVGKIVPDPIKMEAIIAIDQGDIEFVRADQQVALFVNQLPNEPFESRTTALAPIRMQHVPKSLSSRFGGPLVSQLDETGRDVPLSTNYLVSVPLDNSSELVLDGATGYAKIRTGTQSIGKRVWRVVCRTFRFNL